jgi:hypothetical protein
MLDMLPVVPRTGVIQVRVTNIARLRCMRPGIIEATLVSSRINPRGLVIYEEAVRLQWPLEAILEASEEFKVAKEIMRQELFQ